MVGLGGKTVQPIRLGENALFRVGQHTVARVARGLHMLADAAKEVAVADWLQAAGMRAARLAPHIDQPVTVEGYPVTFWQFIEASGPRPTITELGSVLRELHALPLAEGLRLPDYDMFGRAKRRIAVADDISESDRRFLSERYEELFERYEEIEFTLTSGALHGDAHQSNLMRDAQGNVVLIDFEGMAFGPPEADLAMTATEYLIGWHTKSEYQGFVTSYGWDVIDSPAFPVLRSIHELKMTTWLMQNVGESQRIATEYQTRIAALRDDSAPRAWQPF
ncbi:phosphotransferase enzyme family protein [Streptomyces sp. NPDC058572]|uniref:phosphotransferase enzyme family protein n=1 Tax=Streptomyces sp. NPDC058572 TaxID=3346546 RepID=UPI00365E9353